MAVFALALPLAAKSAGGAAAQPDPAPPSGQTQPDLSSGHTLYVTGYAHLDTQWRWSYPQTIREFLADTLHDNFALFEKYPDYVFNFSGANRYRMIQEYYPEDYETLKRYIAEGRWFPCGSSMEECDVNVPSAESIIRQVLCGNHYFRQEFGTASAELMLPDCFGFPASLPSLLAHCGIKGFSTQKLSWGSAVGIPFNVGVWVGPDGNSVVAAFNPGSYTGEVKEDLSQNTDWLKRIEAGGQASGVYADYMYFGTGDCGGAPKEESVAWVEKSVRGGGPVKVVSGKADQLFLDLKPEQLAGLPRYQGDLLLSQHSAGSITSAAYMKRWNHENELLADSAERAAVTASWLGGMDYPQEKLNRAWTLVMGGQFHDILPGTSHPKAYEYSWNDEVLALNQFADVLQSSAASISAGLDTQVQGEPVVVYNPLSIDRDDLVEAVVLLHSGRPPQGVEVLGPQSKRVAAQLLGPADGAAKVLFLAQAPANGFAVYDVRIKYGEVQTKSELQVTESSLENSRYRVSLDGNGDVASVYDKRERRELLSAPVRLAFTKDAPSYWPAWNIDWEDQQQPPYAYVSGPATVRIAEDGPARVALEVTREAEGSRFVQTVSLAAGAAGERVEFRDTIDWRSTGCHLKAEFPLSVNNPLATYNWEAGTIQRGNNDEKKYEVPAHQWFDLTDKDGSYGVTVLCPFKYGSDKPDDHTLRLTLLRTPGVKGDDYADQASQDWGRHEITFGLAGHAGDWRMGRTYWQALRLEQPPVAFGTSKHGGALGRTLSLFQVSSESVRVLAVKKAEDSDEIVLRLVELDGQPQQDVRVEFAAPLAAAREVNGQEQALGAAPFSGKTLALSFAPYEIHTLALKLGAPETKLSRIVSQPVELPYDTSVASRNGEVATQGFDPDGRCLAAEMLPGAITDAGVTFTLGPAGGGQQNALTCHGQSIDLPPGEFNRLYLLAASSAMDQTAEFQVEGKPAGLTIQDWGGFIGQWDNRVWQGDIPEMAFQWPFPCTGLRAGYVKRAPVAWFCSHRHDASGQNELYSYSYLYRHAVDLPPGAKTLTLPDNPRVRVLALSLAHDPAPGFHPAQPLYDTLDGHQDCDIAH
jgi:alpha-mannosidase